jgi:hypothetical protein
VANRNLVVQKHALLIKYGRITILGRLRFTRPSMVVLPYLIIFILRGKTSIEQHKGHLQLVKWPKGGHLRGIRQENEFQMDHFA